MDSWDQFPVAVEGNECRQKPHDLVNPIFSIFLTAQTEHSSEEDRLNAAQKR